LKKGRVVYGGGGIMPDYFVPVDTTLFTKYHSRLSNKGVLLKVHFQLIDTHRDEWSKKYPDYATFNRKFELSDKMMKQLIDEGEKDGVKFDEGQYKKSESLIKLQLKALIARDLWDMNEYYHTINVVNESVNKALELLEGDD
jgi:carboxyl-terminal processing protease